MSWDQHSYVTDNGTTEQNINFNVNVWFQDILFICLLGIKRQEISYNLQLQIQK